MCVCMYVHACVYVKPKLKLKEICVQCDCVCFILCNILSILFCIFIFHLLKTVVTLIVIFMTHQCVPSYFQLLRKMEKTILLLCEYDFPT